MKYILLWLAIGTYSLEFEAKPQTEFYKSFIDLNFYSETGYIQLKNQLETDNYLFYHLFLKEGTMQLSDIKDDDIFAVWLNGGPGGGSQFGNFEEIGPIKIHQNADKSYILEKNQYSWNQLTHQIFVDQPFGAGLSYSNTKHQVSNCNDVAENFYNFLQILFANRPDLKRAKFHLYGESYAGKFIPTIAAYIIKQKSDIKLEAIALGNGNTDPKDLLSYHASLLSNLGMIDTFGSNKVQQIAFEAQQQMLLEDFTKATAQVEKILGEVPQNYAGNINHFNFQSYDRGRAQGFQNWLNDHRAQYNIPEFITYHQNSEDISNDFYEELSQSRSNELVYVLDRDIKVLLFNGQLDYIVNNAGQQIYLTNLQWKNSINWKQSMKQFIQIRNQKTQAIETCGYYKKFGNLMTATIYNAGHMVPMDNPVAALELLKLFLQ